ncbi:hypothetical protein [Streptomyces noursei]|uniref:bestrophin-like domain n=1 Tax=Streptomyces noursei TaxID=1971 RepID=UPI0016768DED|nr:hypothetical protein [Streptomyces noursei]MCZ1021251.1 hypothetical protein [Streptomyces noursei]GGX56282.1 hypothetical protein GCM10010341_91070 [Streptomyces noursei]
MTWSVALVPGLPLLAMGLLLLRWRLQQPPREPTGEHGAVGFACGLVSMLFAVLMGLAIVAVWGSLTTAQNNIRAEAGAARQTYTLAQALPEQPQRLVRNDTRSYVECATGPEWQNILRTGRTDTNCTELALKLQLDTASWTPHNPREQLIWSETVRSTEQMLAARRLREGDIGTGPPVLLKAGLLIDGVAVLAMALLRAHHRNRMDLAVVGLCGLLIAFQLSLIFQIEDPYGNGIQVSERPLLDALNRIRVLDTRDGLTK